MRKFWYKFIIHYCPVCGKEDCFKERIYTIRPKDRSERYSFIYIYDYCVI